MAMEIKRNSKGEIEQATYRLCMNQFISFKYNLRGEIICFVDNWAIKQSTPLFPKYFQSIGDNWVEINGTLEIMKNEVCTQLHIRCIFTPTKL